MSTILASSSAGMFQGAHDLVQHQPTFIDSHVYHRPTFIDNSSHIAYPNAGRPGTDKLLNHSMRDAFHDSAARWPPPRCHDGTRRDLIGTIIDWGTGSSEHAEPILWMHGPFGVGKSALAQTCTEALASKNKLAASVFFSGPNRRNDPDRVFTSIAYQIAINCPSLGEIVDGIVMKDPAVATASRQIQFDKLLANPLRQIGSQVTATIEGWVIVLDGLDECQGRDEQCEIIQIVTTSVRQRSTPFRWFIISRPEVHISHSMTDKSISPLLFNIDIPVSPEIDKDIRSYLISELKAIGEQYHLSPSWPSDADITKLLKIIGGLWVALATIIRFVGDTKFSAPITQLSLVLSFGERLPTVKFSPQNPWDRMDLLYHFLLQQLPSTIVSRVRKTLLLNRLCSRPVINVAIEFSYALGLPKEEFEAACGFLHSVLYLSKQSDDSELYFELEDSIRLETAIKFYHTSFLEFMEDEKRSGDFCIYGDCVETLRQEVVDRINKVHDQIHPLSHSVAKSSLTSGRTLPSLDPVHLPAYMSMLRSLVDLLVCQSNSGKPLSITESVAASLQDLDFSMVRCLSRDDSFPISMRRDLARRNLPPEFRRMIRRSWNPLHYLRQPEHLFMLKGLYVLGHGKNKILCWDEDRDNWIWVTDNSTSVIKSKYYFKKKRFSGKTWPQDIRILDVLYQYPS